MNSPAAVRPEEAEFFNFGGLGVRWMLEGAAAQGRFAVVHHPLAPRALAAPMHYHHNEDEYSYVIRGTLGAMLGEQALTAGPGTWVKKPRHQWHTFWNAGDEECEIIEVISPAGFENYFREMAAAWPDASKFATIGERYRLEMDFSSVPGLCERFGLRFPEL